jgi:hypothetical protein
VALNDIDRLGTRLFAINLRLAELKQEMHRTQVRVCQLESQLEDARLAKMMGHDAGNPAEIAPELERSRGSLESQKDLVHRVQQSQNRARVAYMLQRLKDRRAEREREA